MNDQTTPPTNQQDPQEATENNAAATNAAPTTEATTDPRDAKIEELTLLAKRAVADLANFRRQAEEEKQAFAKFAAERSILALLPVFDNFERATCHLPAELMDSEFAKGLLAIKTQFEQSLKSLGAERIAISVGAPCDPTTCQAIGAGPGAKDTVIEIFETAWRLNGKIIRTAKVRVGDGSKVSG